MWRPLDGRRRLEWTLEKVWRWRDEHIQQDDDDDDEQVARHSARRTELIWLKTRPLAGSASLSEIGLTFAAGSCGQHGPKCPAGDVREAAM